MLGTRTAFAKRLVLPLALAAAACTSSTNRQLASEESAIAPTTDLPSWTARLGAGGNDQLNGVALDSTGAALVAGYSTTAVDGQTFAGTQDALLTKYSSSGSKVWTRELGTSLADGATGVAIGSGDSVYVAGYMRGTIDSQTAPGNQDVWLSKYDSTGTRQWTRLLGTTANDLATGVAVGATGVYVTGYTGLNLTGSTRGGKNDFLIAKYDLNGTQLWAKSYGTAEDDLANGIAVDGSGNSYIVGTTGAAMAGNTALGLKDIFLAKYDDSGNQVWVKQIGTATDDTGTGVAIGSDGGIYVSGITTGALGGTLAGGNDAVLVKFDASGAVVWTRQLGTPNADDGNAVATDGSSVYLVGRTLGHLPGANAPGVLNIFAARYDLSGTVQAVHQYSGSAGATGITVGSGAAAANGRLTVTGYLTSAFDNLASLGGQDAVVLSLCGGHNFACELAGSCSVSHGGCTASQTCTPDVTGYVLCACSSGYTGNTTCSDVNECLVTNGDCDALTTCTNTVGGRTCSACPSGYSGTGATGCTDIDECALNTDNCDPNAACTNTAGSFTCGACLPGFTGTNATGCNDINECLTNNGGCDSHVVCTNTPGSFTCGACPSGFTGTGATGCTDINECLTSNGGCDALTTCTNTDGSRTCGACPSGYSGDGYTGCTDINECLTSNGGCDALTTCTNTVGGRTCGACPSGYSGTGATGCTDIDECLTANGGCDSHVVCTNTAGGRTCGACPDGYTGDGYTGCFAGCATNNGGCDSLTSCDFSSGSIVCGSCPAGYGGNGSGGCLSPPTNVAGQPGDHQITLTWGAPTYTGGRAVTSYVATCNPGAFTATQTSGTSVTLSGLTNRTAYTCSVHAVTATAVSPEATLSYSVIPASVPGAPTSVTATATNTQVTVSWGAPTDNGGAAVSGYTITRNPGGVTVTTTTETTTTFSGLTNGTSYTFTVYASNNIGDGASASATATPATKPGAPTTVTGTPGNGSVTVSWTAPSSNGGSAITQSVVTASPGGATATVTGSGTSATVTGLTNGTAYTFTVVSSNVMGAGPASSASAAVTPRTVPGAPLGVTGTPGNTTAVVNWTAPTSNGGSAITSYQLTGTSSAGNVSKTTGATSYSLTGLTNGASYVFTVKACNAAGCGASSAPSAAVVPFTLPSAPQSVTAVAGDGQATVSWSAPSSNGGNPITSYTVRGGPQSVVVTSGLSTTLTGLSNGSVYNFSVVATTIVGDSSPGWASPVTPTSATCEPTDICNINNGGCALYQACTYNGCTHVCGCAAGLVDTGTACATLGPAWTARPGTSGNDQINATAIDSAGNVIVAGYVNGALDGQTYAGAQDAFVTKYSPTGTKLWTRLTGTTLADAASGVAVGSSNSIYVAGYMRGTVDGQTGLGGQDVWLTKYDSAGTKQWTRLLGTSANDVANGVTVSGGMVYVTGLTALNLSGSTRGGKNDALVAKYDENGTLQWAKSFGTTQDDAGQGIAVDSSGVAYVFGSTYGSMPGNTALGGKDVFLARYDSAGTQLSVVQGASSGDDNASAIARGPDGAMYLAGSMVGPSTGSDAFLLRYDTSVGDVSWLTTLGSSTTDEGWGVAADSSGVYLSGRSLGQLPGANSYGDTNLFLARYDFSGNVQTVREYAGTATATGVSLGLSVAVASGRVVVAGAVTSSFDNLASLGGTDGIILDVCTGTSFACELTGSCSVSNGGCTATQTCTGASSTQVYCACGMGYTGSTVCTDVNECRANNGFCDALTTCTNTTGGHACTACPSGYSGTGETGCTDINECATNNGGCDPVATCVNTAGSHSCGPCPPGYNGTGDTTCTDINECATNNGNCDPLTTCTNTAGSRTCSACPTGYSGSGDTFCSDINECAVNNGGCGSLTNCTNTVGGFSCGTKVAAYPSTVTIGGPSSTTIKLTMIDPSGNPQAGETVQVSVSGSGNSIFPASGVTDASGTFRATLASRVAETKTVTVQAGGQSLTTTVTFQAPTSCASGFSHGTPLQTSLGGAGDALTVADFNADGKLDVAATNSAAGTVLVALGNGNGTFATPTGTVGGENLASISHGDFNRDGRVDLVVVENTFNTVKVLFGNGDGTFQLPTSISLDFPPVSVVAGDFDADGDDDLLVATVVTPVTFLAGDGAGNFAAGALAFLSPQPNAAAVRFLTADTTGDGLLDLVLEVKSASDGTETSYLFDGSVDGSFLQAPGTSGAAGMAGATGDFNADGLPDIGVAATDGSMVMYLAGSGTANAVFGSSSGNALSAGADLNGDGRDDLLFAYSSGLALSMAQSDGTMGAVTQTWTGTPAGLAIADFDRDGRLDIVAVSSDLYVLPNNCQ